MAFLALNYRYLYLFTTPPSPLCECFFYSNDTICFLRSLNNSSFMNKGMLLNISVCRHGLDFIKRVYEGTYFITKGHNSLIFLQIFSKICLKKMIFTDINSKEKTIYHLQLDYIQPLSSKGLRPCVIVLVCHRLVT